jgi:all-trans-retinol dehydrogenase (NAD+)
MRIFQAISLVTLHFISDYSSSKFAAFGFAESLFLELTMIMKTKVKSTIVCPYFIKTGMFEGCTTK